MICDLLLISGTDILIIEYPGNESEMNSLCETIEGTSLAANTVAVGRTTLVSDKDLFAMGFQFMNRSICLLGAALDVLSSALTFLRTGSISDVAGISSLNELLEFPRICYMDKLDR
jgi:2-methylisocitrate lyase-like PEP mutase family enzyme